MTEPTELYRKHRPQRLADVVGQDAAIASLKSMSKDLPHVMLFSGPSGCGKTTLARILCSLMKIDQQDTEEKNAATDRGIDDIREIQQHMRLCAIKGKCRAFILDECHKYSNDAQTALLKTLEDTPPHVYFFLCTTDPGKLIKTVRSRGTEIKLESVKEVVLKKLAQDTAMKEGKPISDDVAEKIAFLADGGARKAMVLLHQVINVPADGQIAALMKHDLQPVAFDIVQKLCKPGTKWKDLAPIIAGVKGEGYGAIDAAEGLRRLILGYAQTMIIKGGSRRAYEIIDAFWRPLYEIGWPGLCMVCYELCEGRA